MPSLVEDIVSGFKSEIATLFPTKSESKFVWDITKNASNKNSNIYAVRPLEISTVAGTNKTITKDQQFAVILSTIYQNKADGDAALQAAIFDLFNDHEILAEELYRRKLGLQRVLLVNAIAQEEPEIDTDNKIVSIEALYTVKYRTN